MLQLKQAVLYLNKQKQLIFSTNILLEMDNPSQWKLKNLPPEHEFSQKTEISLY